MRWTVKARNLELTDRLSIPGPTLAPVDLLLTKLQIVEVNEKDLRDVALLLFNHPVGDGAENIDGSRLSSLCADDWGLTTTVLDTMDHVREWLPTAGLDEETL